MVFINYMIRDFHDFMAWLPLAWCANFLLCIVLVSLKLGHVPAYGHDPDLTGMGLELYVFFDFLLLMGGVFSLFM